MLRVSIFGLGYVGCVSAACLAQDGHSVIGVDISSDKVAAVNAGKTPIIEKGLAELVASGVAESRLCATTDPVHAVLNSDISFVCVGTPSSDTGGLDLEYVRRVASQIGEALRAKDGWHTVTIRSTMLPGSTEEIILPLIESAAQKQANRDFGVCFNPEFLREGTALRDFYEPSRTVIGQREDRSGDLLERVYDKVNAPVVHTDVSTAEMVKYADNAFHGLKVVFGNEIGNICKALGLDSHAVMDIFIMDSKLNLSPVYLKPGYAFGGSCLPKDLRALIDRAAEMHLDVPLLRAVLKSNERQKQLGLEMIRRTRRKKIGVLGLSFKQGTDDLRESPIVELVETLVGKGYDVAVYDRNVSLSTLVGSNRAYIDRELPHLSVLMRTSLDELLEHAEVIVVTNKDPEFVKAVEGVNSNHIILDFVRLLEDSSNIHCKYEGICW